MSVREDRSRRAILDAAAVVLTKDPGASTAQISQEAGIGRTTLHRYYPNREALVEALAVDALDRVDAALTKCRLDDGPAPQILRRVTDELVPLAREFQFLEVGASVWAQGALNERWYQMTDRLRSVVERGKRDGDLRADLPTAWVVDVIASTVVCAGESIVDGRIARNDGPQLVLDVLLHGISA